MFRAFLKWACHSSATLPQLYFLLASAFILTLILSISSLGVFIAATTLSVHSAIHSGSFLITMPSRGSGPRSNSPQVSYVTPQGKKITRQMDRLEKKPK